MIWCKKIKVFLRLLCISWQCFDLNKFEAVPTEGDLVNRAHELLENDTYWAGVVFENLNSSKLPSHVKYKIRMDIDQVERTNNIKDGYVTQLSLSIYLK